MLQSLMESGLHPVQMKDKLAEFMHKIQQLSELLHIDLSNHTLDHIALRINEMHLAKAAHLEWLKEGEEISCAQINGRPIIVIAFDQPLAAAQWMIECLELPYPATGKTYPDQSWEHVEFVVPSEAQTADDFLADLHQQFPALAQQWSQLAELGVKTKLSSPKGEGERLNNPTVAFKWQGVCIKLHPHTLKAIVESER
ncbi:VOC family protein [Vibrio fluvialis]|nr:VOC family protein [Vibrio fluvialis]